MERQNKWIAKKKIFWDTLFSLKDNENLPKNIIKYPKYLFRYKSLTIDNLADIKNNKLKFDITNRYQLNTIGNCLV